MSKVHANRGAPRNKKPLQNIVYKFEKGRDGGFCMLWGYERDLNRGRSWNFHGAVTREQIRARLTSRQWLKFLHGARTFVHQRRVDGRNIPVGQRPQ